MATRVVIADDNLIIREGLAQLLASEPDIDVVAVVGDAPSALRAVEEHQPDLLLTDIRMPPGHTDEGIRLAASLRETHPSLGVIVLSGFGDPGYVLALLDTGSEGRGYLLKERVHDRAQLRSAIEVVAAGGAVLDPKIVEPLVAAKASGQRSALAELTPRERDVLAEIAEGSSNGAIAESLVLTKRAVEKHINSIFLKLDLANEEDISKRVKAALVFLAESGGATATPPR